MKYERNSKTISGRLSDELVMMDIDKGKYFSLNPVATRIWDLLVEPMSVDELCSLLMNEYDVEAEQCQEDVTDVLDKMVKLDIILTKK
jgi:hypothetical protein